MSDVSSVTADAGALDRWLIALDIDGTIIHEDGTLTDVVRDEVTRVSGLGHEIMLATGRSEIGRAHV